MASDSPTCEDVSRPAGPRPVPTDLADVRERARAALVGFALGDALGATVEFMTAAEIRSAYGVLRDMLGGGWLRLAPGQVTDDTQMSLCIARSIDAVGWSPVDIAERFAAWLRSRPVDVGNTCRRGIQRYMRDGSLFTIPSDGDAGNGAVMRMTPVAIASLADPALLARRAREQAHITHHHPLSDASCVLFGRLLQLACLGRGRGALLRVVHDAAQSTPSLRLRPYRALCSAYVVDTMRTVIHFFFSTRSFEQCLVATVNVGGDADTAGALVGALAGAYYGLEQIPMRWLKRLDRTLVRELGELALRLVDFSPLAHGEPASRRNGARQVEPPSERLDPERHRG
jgi:ADP-ribosyl-[dinitrogen reductase] hydrolase